MSQPFSIPSKVLNCATLAALLLIPTYNLADTSDIMKRAGTEAEIKITVSGDMLCIQNKYLHKPYVTEVNEEKAIVSNQIMGAFLYPTGQTVRESCLPHTPCERFAEGYVQFTINDWKWGETARDRIIPMLDTSMRHVEPADTEFGLRKYSIIPGEVDGFNMYILSNPRSNVDTFFLIICFHGENVRQCRASKNFSAHTSVQYRFPSPLLPEWREIDALVGQVVKQCTD